MVRRVSIAVLLILASGYLMAQAAHGGRSALTGSSSEQGTVAVTVTALNILPQGQNALVGTVVPFSADATLSNGAIVDVTAIVSWASTSPVLASVGVLTCTSSCVMPVTCNSAGAAQIQAAFGTLLTASSTLTCTAQPPPPPSLVSIAVTPITPSINVGQNQSFTATGTYSDGSTKDITSSVGWNSSNTAVATMDGLGPAQQANCITSGTSTIKATDPTTGINGSTTLTCVAVLSSITVAPSAATILVGSTQQFAATCNYSDGTTKNCTGVTWNSSATGVATINSSGLATGMSAGTSNITAVIGSITSNTAVLTVNNSGPPPPTLTSITVTPANSTINVGANLVYLATCNYSDGSTQNCTLNTGMVWASSNTGVATISAIAVATGVSAGSTTISATYQSIVGSTGLTVQAPPTLLSIAVTPVNPTQNIGSSILFTATGTYSSGPNQNVTAQAVWTFGTGGIAAYLAQSGGTQPAQCNAVGSTTVIATIGAVTGNTTLTCQQAQIITGENAYCSGTTDASCFQNQPNDGPAQLPTHGMYTGENGTPAPGSTIDVTSNAQMTSALSSVTCGQTIRMHVSGGPYAGFTLPAKSCDSGHWIWIETDQTGAAGFPAEHNMVTPCQSNQASVPYYPSYTCPTPAQLLAQIVCTGTSCIKIAAGANYYRLIGLDIYCNPTAPNDIGACVDLTPGGAHFIFDRDLIHGQALVCTPDPVTGAETCTSRDTDKGIASSSTGYVAAINGWIYDIVNPQGSTTDTNGFGFGGNGTVSGAEDVKKIYNELIAASGEAWLSGGGGVSGSTVYTPNDIEIRNAIVMKPVSWLLCNNTSGVGCHDPNGHNHPVVKNNGELKNANRVLVEGVTCLNSWQGWQTDQSGFCLLLTPKNQSSKTSVTNVSSDATGTILTGTFPSDVVSSQCATANQCEVTFSGTTTKAQTWSATSITVSPAVTPNLTGVTAAACNPGLNPAATVTNATFRYIDIRNTKNGISFASALSDCGDLSAGINAVSIHDIREQGVNWILSNISPSQTGFAQQCIDIVNAESGSQAIQNFDIEHMTCAQAVGHPSSFSGVDFTLDETDITGNGSGDIINRIQRNNIGPMGALAGYHNGRLYPNGLNNGITKQSGTSWVYTRNVLGTGQYSGQSSGIPLPPSNADPGDSPAGTGCNSSQATCHPNGPAFTGLFTQYNGPAGQPGYLGNYVLSSAVYATAATDGTAIGVSNWTTFNTKLQNTLAPNITYTAAAITTTSLATATQGVAYTQNLLANSAGPMQQWSITSGSLPNGITLTNCGPNWCLTGTSTIAGTFPLSFQMMDGAQQYATANLTLVVAASGGPSANANWQVAFTNPSGCTQAQDFSINTTNNEWYLACRDSGFWKSTNQGVTWTQINGGNSTLTTSDSALNTGGAITGTCTVSCGSGVNSIITHSGSQLWLMFTDTFGISSGSGTITQAYPGTGSYTTTVNLTGLNNTAINAYPFILQGCDPFSDCYTGQPLHWPQQLSSLTNLYSDINYTFSGTLTGRNIDMLFDEWVCNNNHPTNSTQCLEVEILPYYNFTQNGCSSVLRTVTLNVTINGSPSTMAFDECKGGNVIFIPHSLPGATSQELKFDMLTLLNQALADWGSVAPCSPNACQWLGGNELGTEFGDAATENYSLSFSKIEYDQVFTSGGTGAITFNPAPAAQGWKMQWNPNDSSLIATIGGTGSGNTVHYYRSTNDGSNWSLIDASGYHNTSASAFSGCAMPVTTGGNLVCGGFFGSNNQSEFYSANNGATTTLGTYTPAVSSVLGLGRNPFDSTYWTGTENGGIFCSTNGGNTWANVFANQATPPNTDTNDIAFDKTGNVLLSNQGGVWRGVGSNCGTYAWTNTYVLTRQGRANYTDSYFSIYWSHAAWAANPNTVYRSTNNGVTFTPWDTGLPQQLEVFRFVENPSDGKIYAVVENPSTNAGTVYSTPK